MGTALPVPLLLCAKLIALTLLATQHVRLLPDPFLAFIPRLDALPGAIVQTAVKCVFVGSAVALLANRWVRASAATLGLTILFSVVSSRAYYGNNKPFCGVMLVLIALYASPRSAWLARAQVAVVYFGAGLNKLLDGDWRSGQFFDHWAGVRLGQPLYVHAAALVPPLALGKAMCWFTIATELGLSAAFLLRRLWPWAIWVSLLFHASLMAFTGSTFVMFFYAMEAAMLVFVEWPRTMTVIYDNDCGICNRVRRWLQAVDFDRQFDWQPLQSGVGERWGIPRQALMDRLHLATERGVTAGFRASKLLVLYNPAFLLAVGLVLALPPESWAWYRRIVAGILLALFCPLFNPIGEAAYRWVARNRYRFSSAGACAVKPGDGAGNEAGSGLGAG